MGTNALKNKDLLHGGKPSSHGRKERRFMKDVLSEKGINNPSKENTSFNPSHSFSHAPNEFEGLKAINK